MCAYRLHSNTGGNDTLWSGRKGRHFLFPADILSSIFQRLIAAPRGKEKRKDICPPIIEAVVLFCQLILQGQEGRVVIYKKKKSKKKHFLTVNDLSCVSICNTLEPSASAAVAARNAERFRNPGAAGRHEPSNHSQFRRKADAGNRHESAVMWNPRFSYFGDFDAVSFFFFLFFFFVENGKHKNSLNRLFFFIDGANSFWTRKGCLLKLTKSYGNAGFDSAGSGGGKERTRRMNFWEIRYTRKTFMWEL